MTALKNAWVNFLPMSFLQPRHRHCYFQRVLQAPFVRKKIKARYSFLSAAIVDPLIKQDCLTVIGRNGFSIKAPFILGAIYNLPRLIINHPIWPCIPFLFSRYAQPFWLPCL